MCFCSLCGRGGPIWWICSLCVRGGPIWCFCSPCVRWSDMVFLFAVW